MKLEIWAAKVELAMNRVVAAAGELGTRNELDPELTKALRDAGWVRDPKIKLLRAAEGAADLLEALVSASAGSAAVDAHNGPDTADTGKTGTKAGSRAKKAQEG